MDEIEVKILEVDRVKVEEGLIGLGAKKVFDSDIQTLFFDFEDRRIAKAKNVLRLRQQQDKIELTYKKVQVIQGAKTAKESSVTVSSVKEMREILENVGLSAIDNMDKHRISYKIDETRFDFDKYSGKYAFVPEFLEIEAENTNSIYKYAKTLGFKAKDCLAWSTDELIQHYSNMK